MSPAQEMELGSRVVGEFYANDLIVEDRSVDLQYSILPNEILHHGKSPYKHARCYLDCVDVAHTNIYDNQNVRNLMVDFLERC